MTPVASVATGVAGFDEITGGGLPVGRLSLVVGTAGTGKTALAFESLARAAADRGETGIFVTFEESPDMLRANSARFAWSPREAVDGRIRFVDARLPEALLQEGDFDLLGLMAQLDAAADQIGATWVVFDGVDVLLDLLADPRAARREVTRLREWVVSRGMVGLVTAKSDEHGESLGSRLDFMQFAVDCVVKLRHTLVGRTSHRTLQVSKYRGSSHSADEYPFAITASGMVVAARGAAQMDHVVSDERVPTGVEQLDELVGGGYWRASSVLVSGCPGTAKTTLAGAFVAAACERGERALFVSFDEAASQIRRNLRSVGIELEPYVDQGLLRMLSLRTRSANVDLHVDRIERLLDAHGARSLVVDPISGFQHLGDSHTAEDAATRLVDACKQRGVTMLTTSLVASPDASAEDTPVGLSTIADAWIHLSYISRGGERNRTLSVIKVRGTGHTNQVRELLLGEEGIRIADVYAAGGEVLLGTLRWEKEREVERERDRRAREAERRRAHLERELAVIRQRAAVLEAEQKGLESDLERLVDERREAHDAIEEDVRAVRSMRGGKVGSAGEE